MEAAFLAGRAISTPFQGYSAPVFEAQGQHSNRLRGEPVSQFKTIARQQGGKNQHRLLQRKRRTDAALKVRERERECARLHLQQNGNRGAAGRRPALIC